MSPHDCPGNEHWQAMLEVSVGPDELERFERHLASCPACQARLDRIEEDEASWRRLGRQVGDPTVIPADATLSRILERWHEGKLWESAPLSPVDLHFLRPSPKPGLLGTLGPYEAKGVIGQGGMGVVLKGFDPALQRPVAIKVMSPALAGNPTARKRFTREGQAAAAVSHEHIVPVYGVAEVAGLPYLVMQYVAGESLQERLDRTGPLAVEEIVRIGLQTAQGLAAAHAQGLIHRDIKPANLLLENVGDSLRESHPPLAERVGYNVRVKITDFGLARTADDASLTQNGVVAGTPEYMAPEQARAEPIDHRADLFSLGSVLYALCTGQPPFRGESTVAVLCKVSGATPPSIRELNPDVPAWLEALIARLMAKDPADRFRSAGEIAALLGGYLAHLLRPEVAPPSWPQPSPARRWLPWFLFAALLLALLGPGLALWLAGGGDDREPGTETFRQVFYQDLRNQQEIVLRLIRVGENFEGCTSPEAAGLRVTIPRGRKQDPVGFQTTEPVSGDFEITATYELLSSETPAQAQGGAGVILFIHGSPETKNCGRVGRFNLQGAGQVYEAQHTKPLPEKTERAPAQQTGGQLRLVRRGSRLSYQFQDRTTPGQFKTLYETEFGTEDLIMVRYVVNPGKDHNAVDARLIDLRIRTAKPEPVAAESSPSPPLPLPASPPAPKRRWLAALAVVAALSLLASLGVWLYLRRHKKSRAPETTADAPTLSCRCPACGKSLKARSALAGKKIKCPQCGQPVLVSRPDAGTSNRAPS